ncbi:hypothetical protein F2Q68_00043161 [Brassica cretica]|uniref:Zinc knuckle CX2CX4HX4C domain-containing protein n=1 Tax=Brassica cretica TaxID=69181 RepID=A0A8S9LLH1_BRACR|nr:hypothetical protein F2Q68_00043161 [Brassica cretica]
MNMEIQLPSDDIITVEFEYIKIQKHCFTYFSLFHEDENCPVKPRHSLSIKERKLGITQRIALQRIEADNRRHDDRRGYHRPTNLPPPIDRSWEERMHRTPTTLSIEICKESDKKQISWSTRLPPPMVPPLTARHQMRGDNLLGRILGFSQVD